MIHTQFNKSSYMVQLTVYNTLKHICYNVMYTKTCTMEMQGLSSCQLAELARRQSKLVALKLQSNRSLWLGDTVMTTGYVSQLGDLHHISTFNRKEQFSILKDD